MESQYIAQEVRARNDPNGNPQRVTRVWTDDGTGVWLVSTVDHGYRFSDAYEVFRHLYGPDVKVAVLPSVPSTRSEYHRIIRDAKRRGLLSW